MQILLRIIKMAWHYRIRLALAYISFLAAVGFSLLVPYLFGSSIDRLVRFDPVHDRAIPLTVETTALAWMAFALIGVSVMRGLANFARIYSTDSLSQKVAFDLRNLVYGKLQHLSFAFHDTEHTGNLMSKATADVESVRRFVSQGLVRSLDVSVRLIAITTILIFLNWKLALLSLICIPFIVLRATLVLRRLRVMWLHVQALLGELSTVLQENLVGIHVVKAFAAEAHEQAKYDAKSQELRREYVESERLQASNTAWMTLYSTLTLGLILWFGGLEVLRGHLTAGGLTQFVLYLSQLAFPIRVASRVINTFSRALSAGERLFEVLDARSPVEDKPTAKTMGRVRGQVCFDDVSFAYDSQTPALEHVEIAAKPGQMIAILGAPGSGKSSIVNLLPRFYDVTAGRITIDGDDIRDVTLNSLRRNVGMVQQDVFLFSATIRENIAYGAGHVEFDDVVKAAKIAQLHDQIMLFPDGYDTEVGERGVTLSGGQKQRLAIARTVLLDPPILILDDATSSVDVETERLIHRAMIAVMQGRTTFVIAHRLSTVRDADLILVLREGEIAEQGSHRELLTQRGLYRDIYELQFRPQEELLLAASMTPYDGVK